MDLIEICNAAGVCRYIPAGWLWLLPLFWLTFAFVVFGIPIMQIIHRAGFSRWWIILAFIPLVNVLSLWVLAFVRWPAVDRY